VNPSPEAEVGQCEISQSEISQELQNTSKEEDNPFKQKVVIWSGEHQLSVVAFVDSGSDISIVNKKVVTKLDAPINRLTTPAINLFAAHGNTTRTEGTVILVLRFTDSSEYTETRFHVMPGDDSELPFDILLGMDWLKSTNAYLDGRKGGEIVFYRNTVGE